MPELEATTVAAVLRRYAQALGGVTDFQVEPCGQLTFHIHGAARPATYEMRWPFAAWLSRLLPMGPRAVARHGTVLPATNPRAR
jgi:hypothetical protein